MRRTLTGLAVGIDEVGLSMKESAGEVSDVHPQRCSVIGPQDHGATGRRNAGTGYINLYENVNELLLLHQ